MEERTEIILDRFVSRDICGLFVDYSWAGMLIKLEGNKKILTAIQLKPILESLILSNFGCIAGGRQSIKLCLMGSAL